MAISKFPQKLAQNQYISGPVTLGGGWGHRTNIYQGRRHRGAGGKGRKEKKRKSFKILKGCHLGQNIIVLAILEHLELEK